MLPKVQFFFASTPNAATGADSGTAGAGGGVPGGGGAPPAPTPGQGGSGGGQGGGQGGGAGSGAIDWKTAPEHFRREYETLKSKHEPWEKLGVAPDQIGRFQGTYNKVSEQAINVGTQLGYTKDEIIEALEADPVKTIDFLRNQAAAAEEDRAGSGGDDLQSQIDAAVEERFAPIQQRENERMTTEANALFERTVYNEIVNAYKADGVDVANIPEDEKFMLTSATSEIMKYDDKALHALKFGGSTASIQKCFQEAKTYLDKYYMARSTRERGAVAGGPPKKPGAQQQNNGGRRPTLDEMIEEPTLINNKYKVGT